MYPEIDYDALIAFFEQCCVKQGVISQDDLNLFRQLRGDFVRAVQQQDEEGSEE